jgi:hypothetical protein
MRAGFVATSCFTENFIRGNLAAADVGRFLHVAKSEKEPVSCLEQGHEALMFLYQDLLRVKLGEVALPQPPRLLARIRYAIRVRHYSRRTEKSYAQYHH